jgi:hypothetical protein
MSAVRVVFHLGVHHTDEGRLVRSLLRNRDTLSAHGVVVPGPGRYRKVLRDVVNRLRGTPASAEAEELLTEAIVERDAPETLVLSNESFICLPDRALDEARLYARAFKTAWLRQVFPRHEVTFALALRNPATFVPALFRGRMNEDLDFEDYMTGIDPRALNWSDAIATIRAANPDAGIVVWCNEDSPILWGAILRAVTGLGPDVALDGGLDLALQIVDAAGVAAIEAHFGRPPWFDGPEVRRELGRLIEAHARAGEIDEEIDLPGWGEDLMADLTAAYDADVARIAAMPGVKLITP